MRRPKFRKHAVNMSLFPFLAVLVCTMGALIVLLVTVVQQARVYASNTTVESSAARDQDAGMELHRKYEDSLWRREVLEMQRSELSKQLADKRRELSHFEDHIRRLEARWKQLEEEAAQLESLQATRVTDAAATRAEVERLRRQVEQARREVEEARRELANRPVRYSIIPYEGPNGTQRRPVYIECTERGIIIQPEGIVLTPEDFEGPMGPGNPLDAALRTTREYLERTGQTSVGGEPYPLLIVRSDGAMAYSAARAAMRSWDDEFGYELVEADLELEYPPPDPALGQLLRDTVQVARQRQSMLAAAMPSEFQGDAVEGFVATPTQGGFVPVGGGMGTGIGAANGSGVNRNGAAAEEDSEAMREARWTNADSATEAENAAAADTPLAAPGEKAGMKMPLMSSRGQDWALPESTGKATGITRPIRIACLRDQLLVLPEKDDASSPVVIPVSGAMLHSIDEFVSAIWQHMEQWGIAVVGGYWKPILVVEVGPGADERFEELKTLLEGSGMEVTRKDR
jgi:hypothetical protein